ncbi:Two-component sensor histidine kinase, contains HisKA and HATPase domains [Limimaricola pyoseonensis]|uniref:Two-component sensor histidine kinase, contains HisKA and HATPase domains n=1 Tax=Limimaricola pyoseonensis TaxID=521013 RepID=A0A1G7AUL4_9RHOB|nr:Two-component sensor histidine kinase, contains HisKA and HATPase domains [Limimaricola pyoseonensis]
MRDEYDSRTGERAEAIRSLGIMDSGNEVDFDEIAEYAAEICGAPIALVTLVDADRQWAKAAHGTDQRDFTMRESICRHGLGGDIEFLEIEDTTRDPRTMDNPLVTGQRAIRYYGGAVMQVDGRTPVGALCVLDTKPRKLDDGQKRLLKILARQVTRRMELRRALAAQETLAAEVDHRVKNSLQMVTALVRIQRSQASHDETRDALSGTIDRLSAISMLHAELHKVSARNEIALDHFLPDIIRHLATTLPEQVRLEHRLVPLTVASQVAASLALVVNEMVANAAKHAFPDDRAGRVLIELSAQGDRAFLTVSDDGIGSAATPVEPGAAKGLGRQIIDASISRIGGTVTRDLDETGARVCVEFPTRLF